MSRIRMGQRCLGEDRREREKKKGEMFDKLNGVALLMADPSRCNSTNRQNLPIEKYYINYEPIMQFLCS